MLFMITNSLAMRYNMSGRNGKMCFKDTIFWELIYGKDDMFIRNEINFPHMYVRSSGVRQEFQKWENVLKLKICWSLMEVWRRSS